MIVCDTCTILWWTLDPGRLSKSAADALSAPETPVIVSSISIWELAVKVKKGKLELPLSMEDYVTHLRSTQGVLLVPVDENLWLESVALPWEHRDHVDRVIVSLAQSRSAVLLSPDREIRDFYQKTIW